MKLCRFELASSPGTLRSGIVHGGKVYETDGSQPIAVHEWTDARLLSPVGHPPTVRLFTGARPAFMEFLQADEGGSQLGPDYVYLNTGLLLGPQSGVPETLLSTEIAMKPCLGAIVGETAHRLTPESADKLILGYTLAAVLYAADLERNEIAGSMGIVRSHEVGIAVGPALTTLDELEDALIAEEAGAVRYRLDVGVNVNGAEVMRLDTESLPFAFGDLAAHASSTAPLQSGDLLLACLGSTAPSGFITVGSEVRLFSDRLGTLAFRYG